ncbi:hypothetical protein ACFU1Q_11280 [Brachybacterium paraconglomeratum]
MARTKLTLQDVARAAAEKNGGKGGRGLKRLAEAKGLTLSYTTVDRILQGKYESTPQRQTIEALAVLAEMPLEDAYEAAGVPLPGASLAEQLPDGSDNLSTHQRRVVLDVIRGFIRDNDRMADLEQERDARVPARAELLQLANEHDETTLDEMGLDDLYDLAELLRRAVPSLDETDTLVRLATRAEETIERREGAAARGDVADPAQSDGITASADDRPWEQDDYDLAAKRGRNRGREARQRQDHDAEDGGA